MPVLTRKQELFVEAYYESGNVTDAAQQAGYQGSRHILQSIGSQNLSKLIITNTLTDLKQARQLRTNRTQDDISLMLWEIMDNSDAKGSDRISAATLEARLNGWLIERSESKHVSGSPDEWVLAQARLQELKLMPLEELRADIHRLKALSAPQEPRTEEQE